MNNYYVYAYMREDGTYYYIGKGKGRRAYVKHGIGVPQNKSNIIFIEENMLEDDALQLEIDLIKQYGRKDIGTGILRNLTCGGDGSSGYKHTEEYKDAASKRQMGVGNSMFGKPSPNGMLGKTHTEETILKISNASSGENNHWYGVTGENHPMFGRKHTEEQNQKKSERMLGKPKTEEHKKKLSEIKKTEEHKDKLSKANLGKTYYNDGIRHYVINLGDTPEPHWIKGILPRKRKLSV